MSESTISSKGQVTIPKAIRTRMHLKVGDRLRFVVEADGSVRLAAATRDVSTLGDILPRPKHRATVDEMQSAIRRREVATAQLRAADSSAAGTALQRYRSSSADFADCLLGVNNLGAGCEYTATFDRKASKLPESQLLS